MPWYYAIAERDHDIQNPTSADKIRLMGDWLGLGPESRVLTILDPFSNGQEVSPIKNEIERLSHGALSLRVVRGKYEGTDYEAAAIRDMRHGRADLAYAGSRAFDEFGANGLLLSICDASFAPGLTQIANLINSKLQPPCMTQ